MFQGLNSDQIPGALEALLFVSDEPVGTITLAEMLECEVGLVEEALRGLKDKFDRENRGIQLREVAGGWRLFTHPIYHDLIEQYVLSWDTRKLTSAAMETLAIIAYTQPATRSDVSSLRGVNSDSTINSLIEKGLIRELGVAQTVGNPALYGTTQVFLEKFGLRSVHDLPDLSEFAPDDETRHLIEERLSVTRESVQVNNALIEEFDEDRTFGNSAQRDESKSSEAKFSEAIADTLGLVEKIDFDSLVFDTEDE